MGGLAYLPAPLPPDWLRRYRTLLEVGEIIHSKQRPEELFHSLAELLRRIFSFDGMAVSLLEPDKKSVRLELLESFVIQQVEVGFVVPLDQVPAGWVIEDQKPMRVLVRENDPRFELHNRTLKNSGVAASLHLPLTTSMTRLGELVFVFTQEPDFPPEEIDFMQRVADQIAVAIENARNLEEARRSQQRYQMLLDVSDLIHASQNLDQLFSKLAEFLRRVIAFDAIAVGLREPDKPELRLCLFESWVPQDVGVGLTVPISAVPAGWVMEHQQALRVRTVDNDPRFALHNELLRQAGLGVSYHLPLTTALTRLGELAFGFRNDNVALPASELQFMQRVAHQVALAIENTSNFEKARKIQRELEHRNAQRELLLQLTNSVVSHLSLTDVLHAAVRGVRRVVPCEAAVVLLPLTDGKNMRIETVDFPDGRGAIDEGVIVPIEGSMAGRTFKTGTVVVANEIDRKNYTLEMYERVTRDGIQTQCFIPVVSRGRSLGVLALARREKKEFSEDEVEFLKHVADQIAIALENSFNYEAARSAEQQRKKERDRLQLLMDVTNHLSSNLELPELLQAVVRNVRLLMQCDIVTIHLPNRERTSLRPVAMDFPDGRLVLQQDDAGIPIRIDEKFAQNAVGKLHRQVFQSGKPISAALIDPEQYPFEADFLAREGIVGGCVVPMIHRGKVVGNLGLGRRDANEFTREEIDFLCQFGSQVAIAIENALVYTEIGLLKEKLAQEKLYLEDEIRNQINFQEIVGESPVLKSVLQRVQTVASSDATVLILGETGTGKELIARAIHETSKRKGRTFVKMNCAAIPTGLLESELFGHERGAFTGAIAQKIGRMELANGGTLFLDEVGDIPLELQPKLLRVLQEREFERLGSVRTQKVDVRILAATHRDLKKMVDDHQFRSDLFYRLNVFPINIPPLRQRREDIPRLVRYFVAKYARKMDKRIETIPTEVMRKLQDWSWPGNVRELENVVERSVILTEGSALYVPVAEFESAPAAEIESSSLRDTERDHIVKILRETNWILSGPNGAAARLGVKRTTLQYKIKKLGINRDTN